MNDVATLLAPRILVVEDEALISEEIHDRLERLGYRVVGRVDTGPRAIQAALEARPDLVLMDIRLKGDMDGILAAERIRAQLDVPVVYLTAHSDHATLQRARSSAPFGYVLKPFQERDLLVAVEMALQRHAVETRLRESEARYATTLASIDDGVIATDLAGAVTYMNPVAERLTGWAECEARGRPAEEVVVLQGESDGGLRANPLKQALTRRAPVRLEEPMLLVDRQGQTLPMEDSAAPIVDSKGKLRGAVMAFRDGRPRRAAEQQLRQVEAQLLHSQKMEAVGRLASGVAHDFNNMITAILGHGELLLVSSMLDERLVARVREIQRAGERAAELTRKLLAYSRRQELAPKVVDLNRVVEEVRELLLRLIGADVVLGFKRWKEPLVVRVDTGQIEQVLLNLAVNARDAMPEGGRLTIETRRVEQAHAADGGLPPGACALLVVSDTGTGMDEHTRAHLFEPFFTTKPAGVGTGLGLATVYGIVKQSGGHIEVDSRKGAGSSFSIYLPLVDGAPSAAEPAAEEADLRGTETILFVEDDAQVRSLSTLTLESKGYTVLAASSPGQALELFAQRAAEVRLVVTGMLMPGMNGRQLAERLRSRAPTLRVLYLSGYVREPSSESNPEPNAPWADVLHKPFTPSGLGQKVRALLDRPEGG